MMRGRVGGTRPARSGVTPPRGAGGRGGEGRFRPARGEQWASAPAMWRESLSKEAKQVERRASCRGQEGLRRRGLRHKGAGDRKDRRRKGVLAKAKGEPERRAWAVRSELATAIDECCGERQINNNLWKLCGKL